MSQGETRLLNASDIEGWARSAQPGERLIYCTGPFVPPGAVKAIIRHLIEARAVRAHMRRAGAALEHYLIKRGQEEPPGGRWRLLEHSHDEALEAIYEALERAAARRRRCFSDAELAKIAGLATRNQAAWRFKKLIETKRIRSHVVAGPDGRQWRIVTIVASGRSTRTPTKPERAK